MSSLSPRRLAVLIGLAASLGAATSAGAQTTPPPTYSVTSLVPRCGTTSTAITEACKRWYQAPPVYLQWSATVSPLLPVPLPTDPLGTVISVQRRAIPAAASAPPGMPAGAATQRCGQTAGEFSPATGTFNFSTYTAQGTIGEYCQIAVRESYPPVPPATARTNVDSPNFPVATNDPGALVVVGIDSVAPTVAVAVSRPADASGWYNRPVTISWTGTEATTGSGIASCTPAVTYSGPDTEAFSPPPGSCTDRAGNVSAPSGVITIKYDATPPATPTATATATSTGTLVQWTTSPDTVRVDVERTNALAGGTVTPIYSGALGNQVLDAGASTLYQNTYRVIAYDRANNAASSVIVGDALPPPPIVLPPTPTPTPPTPTPPPPYRPGNYSVHTSNPTLSWTAKKGATYYNVQVYARGRKILSAWPRRHWYAIPTAWKLDGKRIKMPKGVNVRWYVWPVSGTQAKPKFGKLIASAVFKVR